MSINNLPESIVLDKCSFFSTVQLWPRHTKLNPSKWLENFEEDELEYAVHLLHFFNYYSEDLVDRMFISTIHNLSNYIRKTQGAGGSNQKWQHFLRTAYVTLVSGEDPNPTDSGYGFTRKARNLAGFDEDRIISHNYIFDGNCTPGSYVIFVDDFVGSGSQAYETMERKCDEGMMLIEHLQANNLKPIYCPLMCTEGGLHFLNQYSPDLMMVPTHMIDRRYSIFDKDSLCWSGETQKKGIDAVYKASMRAGIPDNPDSTKHWKGFQDQGLAISFSHGTPDATIPLLYWSENDWHPLIRK